MTLGLKDHCMPRIAASGLALLLPFLWAYASVQHHAVGKLTGFGIADGLSNEFVTAICEDRAGKLWIATEEGLNRFDGNRITAYYKHTGELCGNALNDVFADRNDPIVWIATQRAGLGYYNYKEDRFGCFRHSPGDTSGLITDDITHIAQDDAGNIWLSTYHQGLERLDKSEGRFAHFNSSNVEGLPQSPVRTFETGPDGIIYIGHYDDGFTVMNSRTMKAANYVVGSSREENQVYCIFKDAAGRIWIGTGSGIFLFDSGNGTFRKIYGDRLDSAVFSIVLIKDNKLMVGTEFNGVVFIDFNRILLDDKDWAIKSVAGLEQCSVRSIHNDRYGNFWFGTYGDGLFFGADRHHELYSLLESPDVLSSDKVLSLARDSDGRLWVGSDGSGIDVLEDGSRALHYEEELEDDAVLCALCDSEGDMWLGTYGGGIGLI